MSINGVFGGIFGLEDVGAGGLQPESSVIVDVFAVGAVLVIVVVLRFAQGLFSCIAVVSAAVLMVPGAQVVAAGVAVGTNGIPPLTCIPCNMGAIA